MPIDPETGREYDESQDLTSGLIDDIDAEIVGSRFEYLDNYNDSDGNPVCMAVLVLQPVDASGNPIDEPIDQHWSCGSHWKPSDDGTQATREDGRSMRFVKTSSWGRVIARVQQLYKDAKFRGSTNKSGWLDGCVFHWKLETFEYGGEIGSRDRLMPSAFIRDTRSNSAPASNPAPRSARSTAPANRPAGNRPAAGTSAATTAPATATADASTPADDWREHLRALAIEHDTHGKFVHAVVTDKELNALVKSNNMLPSVLNSKPEGFHAKTRGEFGL